MLIIRKFKGDDAPALGEIYRANLGAGMIPPGYEQEFLENAARSDVLSLVAELQGKVVACGTVSYGRARDVAWLAYGLVHPQWQRRRIGTAMILTRLSLLVPPETGACTVFLMATRQSRPFFAKHGFGLIAEGGDGGSDVFHTMRFPIHELLRARCAAAVAQSGIQLESGLQVPDPR